MNQLNETYYQNLICKFLTGNASDLERDELFLWMEKSPENLVMFQENELIWQKANAPIVINNNDQTQGWNNVEVAINQKSTGKIRIFQTNWLRIAAIGLILIFAGLALYNNLNDSSNNRIFVSAESNTENIHILPDGSKVWLNDGAEIGYSADFNVRNIDLKGEAFFEVTKNPESPFQVYAVGTKTTVLGTKFNLKADSKEGVVDLFVEEGKVAFTLNENPNQTKILTANQSANANSTKRLIEKKETLNANEISWKTKNLTFDHQKMEEVIPVLEEYYNVTLEVSNPEMLNCDFKSTFNNSTIEEVIETIKFSLNANIEKTDSSYIIIGQPCITQEK